MLHALFSLLLSPVLAADGVERDAVLVGGAELVWPVSVFVEGCNAGTLLVDAVSGDVASGDFQWGAGRAIAPAYGVGLDGAGQVVVTALEAPAVAPAGSGKGARQAVSRFRRGDCADAPVLAAVVTQPPSAVPVVPVVAAVTPKPKRSGERRASIA